MPAFRLETSILPFVILLNSIENTDWPTPLHSSYWAFNGIIVITIANNIAEILFILLILKSKYSINF
jgi:hypothetical protein